MSRAGAPSNVRLPGLDSSGFTTTAAINPFAGEVGFESVLVEWTDSNIRDDTFEGTAREILRVGFSFVFHPMGDLLFNPLAHAGDADYGNLYVAMGDGTAGERAGVTHTIPQRLDALQGKILRITPDVKLRPRDKLSAKVPVPHSIDGAQRKSFRFRQQCARRDLCLWLSQSTPHDVGSHN